MILSRNIKTFFFSISALLITVSIVFNLGHNLFHLNDPSHQHPEIESCSEKDEIDACHRYLVHHEKSESCDGTHDHIGSDTEECFSCKFFSQRHETVNTEYYTLLEPAEYILLFKKQNSEIRSSDKITTFLRGPPVA